MNKITELFTIHEQEQREFMTPNCSMQWIDQEKNEFVSQTVVCNEFITGYQRNITVKIETQLLNAWNIIN